MEKLIIGSRGSNLALSQTNLIKNMINQIYPDLEIEIKVIKTKGDRILDKTISQLGGKEIFIKEIERELLQASIDMAVHSMKDMPGKLPKGLKLSAVPKREDPRDILILKKGRDLASLRKGARIGTGSLRRKIQLKKMREDLEIVPIRGNVETRIAKIEEEGLDGVVLAAAGINRLGLELENFIYLELEDFLPSPGQGILALEIREDREELDKILARLNHEDTAIAARQEREFLNKLGGSCTKPLGAYAEPKGDRVKMRGMLAREDGSKLVYREMEASREENIGERLGELLNEEINR